MKKIYSLSLLAFAALTVSAKEIAQLPNNGFESGWGACTPWTSSGNTKTYGSTPAPWTISQVSGMGGTGATIVGEQVPGYKSESAVKVYISPNSVAASQKVPGFVTLGTTWSTATGTGQNADGGTFGGIKFTARPKAIAFDYKREVTDASQPATVVAYSWKGETSQASVPGNISLLATGLKKVTMVNRDRNILDKTTSKGGAVTKSADFALIAKIEHNITDVTTGDEWNHAEIPFEYLSDENPEMFNVIFAAQNYFDANNLKEGNSLTVDNVRLIYDVDLQLTGTLTIEMGGEDLTEGGQDATINIYENEDGKTCTFELPNFTLTSLSETPIGDIVVPNVAYSKDAAGVTTYSGKIEGLKLLEGELDADAVVNGTIDPNLKAQFKIDVEWVMERDTDDESRMPIEVVFNGKSNKVPSGIEQVVVNDNLNAPVEYFNLQGIRVAAPDAAGLYIRRQGTTATKIIVR